MNESKFDGPISVEILPMSELARISEEPEFIAIRKADQRLESLVKHINCDSPEYDENLESEYYGRLNKHMTTYINKEEKTMNTLNLTNDQLNALQEMLGQDTEDYKEHQLQYMRDELKDMVAGDREDYLFVVNNYFDLCDTIDSVHTLVCTPNR